MSISSKAYVVNDMAARKMRSRAPHVLGAAWCAVLLNVAGYEAKAAEHTSRPSKQATRQPDTTSTAIAGKEPSGTHGRTKTTKTAGRALVGGSETLSVRGRSRNERRLQELQKTPVSASLLTAQTLERLGVQNTRQLARLTPNLYIPNSMPGYSVNNYFIRGIGEIDPQGEPSVGTYIDGVYLTRNMGTMQELLDVGDIQIDRGPVVFSGHQSEGGAVRINTLVPTNTRHVAIQTGYGTYNEYQVGVAASGALIRDKVYGSIAFGRHARDSIDHNYTVNKGTNDIDYTQARGKLRFTPNEDWDITLAFDGTVDGSTNRGVGNLLNPYIYGNYNRIYPKNNYSEAGFTANIRYTLSSHLSLHSTTGIRGYDDKGMYDNFGDYYSRATQNLNYRNRAYSEDIHLHGDYGKVSFNTGAYFLYEAWLTQRWANNAQGTLATNTAPDVLTIPVFGNINQLNRNWAVYGDATYHITPTLTFTAGLRFNWESHSNSETLSYLGPASSKYVATPTEALAALNWGAPTGLAWQADASTSYVQLLPKGVLSWQALPNLMTYVSISQGGKSGGFDFRAQTPSATGALQATTPYRPETVTTYEIGVKADPVPGRVRFNGAIFWNQFDDIQLTVPNALTGLTQRYNAGNGHSAGAEIETSIKITKDLDLHYTASYLYAVLDSYSGTRQQVTLASGQVYNTTPYAGAALPYSPRFQTMGALTYHIPLNLPGRFEIGADVSFQTAAYTSSAINPQTRIAPQTYINAMASWSSPDRRWSVQATGRNLLDHRYIQSESLGLMKETTKTGATVYAPYYEGVYFADPRTIFVSAKYSF